MLTTHANNASESANNDLENASNVAKGQPAPIGVPTEPHRSRCHGGDSSVCSSVVSSSVVSRAWTIADLERRRAEAMAADPLKPGTFGYTPTGQPMVIRRLTDWDALHDRLEATGLCPAWTPETERRHRALLRADRDRA